MADNPPPPGFEPLFRTSPFLDHLGPFFMRKQADGTFIVGVRILPHHANGRGGAHGGLLMTLCDIALGYRTTSSVEPRPMLTTASITTDFAGRPRWATGSRRMSTSTRWAAAWPSPIATSCATASASFMPAACSPAAAIGRLAHSGGPPGT